MSEETQQPAEAPEAETAPEPATQTEIPVPLPGPEDRRALIEAVIFVAEEPLPLKQIAGGLKFPEEVVQQDLDALIAAFAAPHHGIEIRNVAGGYRMYTKAEWHEEVKSFVKTLRPKFKLSMPALETLAVVAYKQPVTVPEIQAVRGVNVSGVINTLLQRKLISPAGRKKVIGKPMMYKTTKEFLVQFGLSGVDELPSLKELEELSKAAFGEFEEPELDAPDAQENVSATSPEGEPGDTSEPEDDPVEPEATVALGENREDAGGDEAESEVTPPEPPATSPEDERGEAPDSADERSDATITANPSIDDDKAPNP